MSPKPLRQALFQAKLAESEVTDKICVQNLQVTAKAGKDVWGREKLQPALISVALSLARPFDSAAQADSLDTSTVHYGILSKDIRSAIEGNARHLSTQDFAAQIWGQVQETAGKTNLAGTEVDVFYPKATLFGDGAGLVYSTLNGEWTSKVAYLRNIRIPCLIGVNPNERERKQPVVVNLQVENPPDSMGDAFRPLEDILVEVISKSTFDTLESLSARVVDQFRDDFFSKVDGDAWLRLRIEKPLAVTFADAPAVEILRPMQKK
ncbi:hypothetical protein BU24DRAFT_427697 [Aaosphaeria arxii CBS 175.79]|uniref:dihydroneopterin aldolase n=1 Tax=Aaosphaeria arxii CBS 175.79 TaxID=1450172 RepID=A0A6A5XCT7_9PLEO|nr:uncharacterized protein BU24DRAFT_427697 [Aaosphaeria arxii CBS 175.79]KAF2010584.1 hypothetical protein BU24DRAFT_427697 [Aaosphaeria arxii CBS 175.79]